MKVMFGESRMRHTVHRIREKEKSKKAKTSCETSVSLC